VAGIIVAVVLFALIFTAGFGYLIFQDNANLNSYQANATYLHAQDASGLEAAAFGARNNTGTLTIYVNNTGGFPESIVSAYVKGSTGKLTPSGVMNLGGSCISGGPLNLDVGQTGSFVISSACYSWSKPYAPISIGILTSRGNVFTTQFPISSSSVVTTITSSTVTTSTAPGVGGGNTLVVVMSATPVQTYSGPCPGLSCITDNVTVFNYSNVPITGVNLGPSSPTNTTTGTAFAIPKGCAGPYTPPGKQADPSGTINPYNGVGQAPHIFFLCSYAPRSGTVGGLASFSGGAYGTQSGVQVYSASVTSNLVQIGSLTNSLSQGVFSSNFFFFKYTACTNTNTPCTTNVAGGMPPTSEYNLPEGAVIASESIYYVAFYVQLTNNFNTTVPLVGTTFEQFDPSGGGGSESDYWIAGVNTTTAVQNGVWYPSYTSTPTLTAYPSDCATVNAQNIPTDHNCIYIKPGQTFTITLAACGPSSSTWDWGSDPTNNGGSCVSSPPMYNVGPSATAGTTVVQFEYKGVVFTQDLSFQGVAFT
jgi:hypothetical protein